MNSTAGSQAAGSLPTCPPSPAIASTTSKRLLFSMADSSCCSSPSSSASSSSSSFYGSSIAQMNHDQLISLLSLLPIESVVSFSMTCRKFRSLGFSDALWESICRREWGSVRVNALLSSLSSSEKRGMSWKRLYQQVSRMGSVSCYRLSSKDGIFPKPRASHSLNCLSDYLILFGGGCEGGQHLDDTWVAYMGNGARRAISWQPLKSGTPSGRFGHTCTVVGDVVVLFGGINDNGVRQNDTWIGQFIRDGSLELKLSWRLLDVSSIAPAPRGAHASCSVGNEKMVIHGGIGLNGVRLDDMWLLDLSNGLNSARWHCVTAVQPSRSPSARSGHTLTLVDETRMVLFGGRGNGYEVLNDVWLFNLAEESSQWVEVQYDCSNAPGVLPLPRVGHSATSILGGRVLIYGGEDSLRHRKDDFWLLDVSALPATETNITTVNSSRVLGKMWKKLKAEGQQPECRSFHSACTDLSGRYIYIFGGMVNGILHPAEAYGLVFDGGLYLAELVIQ